MSVYDALFSRVQRPGRYVGGEVNSIRKEWNTSLKIALVFPDSYELAMSYMGQAILYEILNRRPDVLAERVFMPWPDLEAALREEKLPLCSLESRRPLSDFDVVAISIPFELTYTNVLAILDLGGIPLLSRDRDASHPLVIAGGTASYNPEPYADFIDAVGIGDGEALIEQIADVCLAWKKDRKAFRSPPFSTDASAEERRLLSGEKYSLLNRLRALEGIYVPSFFRPDYRDDGRLQAVVPLVEGYEGVRKAVVANIDKAPYPVKMLLPNVAPTHDRIGIEVQRGCTRACRFCQAGYVERPTRQRSPERVSAIAQAAAEATGREEISLLSLSAGDYACLVPALADLNTRFADSPMSVSIPATRTETLTPEIIREIKKVRQTGFTIAPEAGTERMRRVINKGNAEADLFRTVDNVFKEGWRLIKFYYLMGLPTETEADLQGIVREAEMARDIGRRYTRSPNINVSVSSFVPKPFTPFQWHGQDTLEENRRKQAFFREAFHRRPGLKFKWHNAHMSLVEGLFSRGDRRLSALLLAAYRLGCRLDEWEEQFDFAKWERAMEETKTDLHFYVYRVRDLDEVLPWDHLFVQMRKDFLKREYQGALEEAFVADCSMNKCENCGVCDFHEIKNRLYLPAAETGSIVFKKGHRLGTGSALGLGESSPATPSFRERVKAAIAAHPNTGVPPNAQRYRFRYGKTGPATFIGHLDMVNHLRRAIRRLDTPVLYSQGFHPQMRLALGNPLKLGKASQAEYFDLVVSEPLDLATWIPELNEALPLGLQVHAGEVIPLKSPSIQVEAALVASEAKRSFAEGEALEKGEWPSSDNPGIILTI